jgi:hypothetical protein
MVHASMIKEHMEILGSDGVHVGRVDRVEGTDRVKVAKNDPISEGQHHYFPLDWIERVDSHVHLKQSSSEVLAQWKRR